MKKISKLVVIAVICILGLIGCTRGTKDGSTIKLGVVGENNEQWQPVIDTLKEEGITLELVKFSDYAQPNRALNEGEIDLNAFQHYAYLNKESEDRGYNLTVIGESIIAPLGLYSNKIEDISQLKKGDSIAIPNDATNGGRALKVLEAAGIIKVDESAGYTPTVADITDNPLDIKIIELDAAQTARALDDVTISVINGGNAIDSGLIPNEDAIYLEKVIEGEENPYINVIVAKSEDKDNETYKRVVELFQTDEVADVIKNTYKGSYLPAWE